MSIKVQRARGMCRVGAYPQSYRAVIDAIGDEILAALSARRIAILADRVWDSWAKTKALHERAIVDEGAVWDDRSSRLIELQKGQQRQVV